MQRIGKNPVEALNVFKDINALTPMSNNEPEKQNRILVGHTADGTANYMRSPLGKVGEELIGWMSSPITQFKAKLGKFARPLFDLAANDRGFHQRIYDDDAEGVDGGRQNLYRIAAYLVGSLQAIQGAKDALTGNVDGTLNAIRVAGPFACLTFSSGAPGGEAVGLMYHAKDEFQFREQQAMRGIRQKIKAGDIHGAIEDMSALGIAP